jgi:hypothetical protein
MGASIACNMSPRVEPTLEERLRGAIRLNQYSEQAGKLTHAKARGREGFLRMILVASRLRVRLQGARALLGMDGRILPYLNTLREDLL